MSNQLTGSCLCGAVAYRLSAELQAFYHCECAQCRKTTGTIAATNLRLAATPIEWRRGADLVQVYRDADGRDFSHVFCTRCGAGLPFTSRDGRSLVVPAGSLNTPPPVAVAYRQFVAERPLWATLDHDLPAYSGFAPDIEDNR